MESTGIYHIPLYNHLRAYGFTVRILNGLEVRGMKKSLKSETMDERKSVKIKYEKRMEELVKRYDPYKELHKPVEYIRNGLGSWFTCLLYPGMEPTNNLAEQAIREHVIIRKIIGTFRSESGSQNYQYIASLLSTWRLKGLNMFVEMDKILRKEPCGFA